MSTNVGGWRSTKKRGRDDNAIKRDREIAIARQKQHRIRKPTKATSSGQTLRPKTTSGSNNKLPKACRHRRYDKYEPSPPPWMKPPCSNHLTKHFHRRWAQISPQRELFPSYRRKSCRTKNVRYPLIYSDRCSASIESITGRSNRPSTRTIEQYLETHVATRVGGTPRHAKIIVTPEPKARRNTKFAFATSHVRDIDRYSSTVLSAEEEPEYPCSTRQHMQLELQQCPPVWLSRSRRRGNRHTFPLARTCKNNSKNQNIFSSKLKFQKWFLSRTDEERSLFGPEPDYDRSAKLLAETNLRRRKFAASTQRASNFILRSDVVESRCEHAVTASYGRKHRKELSRHCADTSTKLNSERIRSLRSGTNIVYANETSSEGIRYHGLNSSRHRESPKVISREGAGPIEQPEIDTTTRRNIALRKLYTQKEDSIYKSQGYLFRREPCRPKHQKIHLGQAANDCNTHKGILATPKNHLSKTTILNKNLVVDYSVKQQQFSVATEKWMTTPSQTPSTESSAVLSLPVNVDYHSFPFSTLLSKEKSSIDGNDVGCDLQPRLIPNNKLSINDIGDVLGKTTSSEFEKKKKPPLDPLRDIEFWQQMALIKEAHWNKTTSCNDSSPKTFKHALAALVIAKNLTFGKEKIDHNNGFLWLPSTLKGSANNIGFFNDGIQLRK